MRKKNVFNMLGLLAVSMVVMTGCSVGGSSPGAQTASNPVAYQEGYKEWLEVAKKAATDPERFKEENKNFTYRYSFHLGDNMWFSAQLLPNGKVVECLGSSASPSCNWNPSESIDNW